MSISVPRSTTFFRFRFADVLVLQGPPLLGAAFAMTHFGAREAVTLLTLLAGNLFLMTHVFMVNDWAGLEGDLSDPNKASRVFTSGGAGPKEVAMMATGLLIVSLVFFGSVSVTAAGVAIAIALFSVLYSVPPFLFKGRPILNSAVHLCGGILHFLLGYGVLHDIDSRGVAIAVYFALIFAAGHLTQEVRDHRGDSMNEIATNAVTFGPRATFAVSMLLFAAAHVLFFVMALERMVPRPLVATVALFLIQIFWSFETMRDGLTYASVSRLQSRYRVLYAFIGACIVIALEL